MALTIDGSDPTGDLGDLLASKAPTASPTFTGNLVWSGATLRADHATVNTSQTTTSTSFTDLATAGPSVTVTTGTKALIIISAGLYTNSVGNSAIVGAQVSGASTVSPDNNLVVAFAPAVASTDVVVASRAYLLTGLTAGSNTFTAKYRVSGGTGTFVSRAIMVIDMGS